MPVRVVAVIDNIIILYAMSIEYYINISVGFETKSAEKYEISKFSCPAKYVQFYICIFIIISGMIANNYIRTNTLTTQHGKNSKLCTSDILISDQSSVNRSVIHNHLRYTHTA